MLTDTLPAGTDFVSASGSYSLTGEAVEWVVNSLPAGTSQAAQLIVRTPVVAGTYIVNTLYAARCNEVPGGITGMPVSTQISYATYLPGVIRARSP